MMSAALRTPKVSKGTLLVVDDLPENLVLLTDFLEYEGFQIVLAYDGKQALAMTEHLLPDLILLDVLMPELDGFEVCRYLKSQQDTKHIPIIFMTALSETVDKVNGFKLGAADYITKPLQREEVLVRIRAHIDVHNLQQQLTQQNHFFKTEIEHRKQIERSLQNTANLLAERTAQLEKRSIELQRRNDELDRFSSMVTHELRDPLGWVVTKIDTLLASYTFNLHLSESLCEISNKSESMLNSIDALLSLAAVLRSNYIRVLPLDMLLMLRHLINTRLAYVIAGHQGKIILPDSLPLAKGHSVLVEEVWVNYLSNALKYSGEPDSIRVGAERGEAGMVYFWVRDQGKALSTKECEFLFNPPTSLQEKSAKAHSLGLLIVRQIVEKLGGKVWIESQEGVGNTFYFSLPEAE
ncbi:MAG: hypothetical protein RL368_1874 [Pseudomonadota bacterium]